MMHFPILKLQRDDLISYYTKTDNGKPVFKKLVIQYQIKSSKLFAQEVNLIAYAFDTRGRMMNTEAIRFHHIKNSYIEFNLPVILGNLEIVRSELKRLVGPYNAVDDFEYLEFKSHKAGFNYIGYTIVSYPQISTDAFSIIKNPCPPYCNTAAVNA